MTDVIELMSKAHGKAYDEYWAKHWVRGDPPGFGKVANDAHEFGMRAAIAALADHYASRSMRGIAAEIRSLLQNE